MAKNLIICVLFIALVTLAILGLFQRSQINDHERAIITAEQDKKQAISDRIKAEEALRLTRDTLEKAYLVATNAKRDANKAVYEAQKLRQEHEAFIFKHFDNDTVRLRAWAELYPTLFGR